MINYLGARVLRVDLRVRMRSCARKRAHRRAKMTPKRFTPYPSSYTGVPVHQYTGTK